MNNEAIYSNDNATETQDIAPERLFGLNLPSAGDNPARPDPLPLEGRDNLDAMPSARAILMYARDQYWQAVSKVLTGSAVVALPNLDFIYDQRPAADVDLSPLDGRDVTIWTNPGIEGEIVADKFAVALTGRVARLTIIRWPEEIRRQQYPSGEPEFYFQELFYQNDKPLSEAAWRDRCRREFTQLAAESVEEDAH